MSLLAAVGNTLSTQRGQAPKFYNDWYDPDFKHTYVSDAKENITIAQVDFATTNCQAVSCVLDGLNCLRFRLGGSILDNVEPAFTRAFFTRLGYEDGDHVKIGFWFKIPDATTEAPRSLYKGHTASWDGVPWEVTDPDWHWYEIPGEMVVSADAWQPFSVGVRYGVSNNFVYLRGLTVVNLTKSQWKGAQPSALDRQASGTPVINLNPWVEKIFPDATVFYRDCYEQNNKAFTREVITVPEKGGIEGIRFRAVPSYAGQEFRIHLNPGLLSLPALDRYCMPAESKYLKIGFFLKSDQAQEDEFIIIYNYNYEGLCSNKFIRYLPAGVWNWIETPAMLMPEGAKIRNYNVQVFVDPSTASDVPYFDVCGLTLAYTDNPIAFRYSSNTPAKSLAFYGKKYTSYGDSVTALFGFQQFILKTYGCNHALRGSGGCTIANKGAIFWADANGVYITRPPDTPPPGQEGVDYFTISAGMCTQQRIDTIPGDTDLLTIQGGTNDWDQGTVIGSAADEASEEDGATLWASLKSCLGKARARLPLARICVLNLHYRRYELTAVNSLGLNISVYRQAIREAAALFGMECIELNELGVNDQNWTTYSPDDVHPNDLYNKLIGEKILTTLLT